MSFRRYEIILPTRYNDGSRVEPDHFRSSYEELVAQFGAVTYQPELLHGIWIHAGERFEEQNVRLYVDVEDTDQNSEFFRSYKETLKKRFRQIDIWITSHEIRIT